MNETLVAEGQARTVLRHMAFLGQESVWAAEAIECAGEQGQAAYWSYHDTLFAQPSQGRNRGVFSRDNLKRYAGDTGLDGSRFSACFDSDRYAELVKSETAAGRAKGVRSTPTIFVNGRKWEGNLSYEQLRQLVQLAAPAPAPYR